MRIPGLARVPSICRVQKTVYIGPPHRTMAHPGRLLISNQTRSLAELFETVHRHIYGWDVREGLTWFQWSCLRYFDRVAPEQRSIAGYHNAFQVASSTASRMVNGLASKGYLKLTRPSGPRSSKVELTARGRDKLKKDPLIPLGKEIDKLPETQRNAIRAGLHTLLKAAVLLDAGLDIDETAIGKKTRGRR